MSMYPVYDLVAFPQLLPRTDRREGVHEYTNVTVGSQKSLDFLILSPYWGKKGCPRATNDESGRSEGSPKG